MKLVGKLAVAYLRWSTDEQSASLEQQRSVILAWAKLVGITIVEWFVDEGVSGTLRDDRRPGLSGFIRALMSPGRVALGVCYDLSRFGRFQDSSVYGYYFTQVHDARRYIYFTEDRASSNDREFGAVITRVINMLGNAEKSRIAATGSIRGQVARALRGRRVAGHPPYGMDDLIVGSDGKPVEIHRLIRRGPRHSGHPTVWHILDPDGRLVRQVNGRPAKQKSEDKILIPGSPERREVCRLIFRWCGRENWGAKRIAAELNRRRIETLTGGLWTASSVLALLKNPAFHGKAAYNLLTSAKVYRIDMTRADDNGNVYTKVEQDDFERGRTRRNDPEQWIVVDGAYQSPVPPEDAALAADRLARMGRCGGEGKEPAGMNPRSARTPALLGDFIKCARCGRNYQARRTQWTTKDGTTYKSYSYACATLLASGSAACARFYVARADIEQPILERVAANLDSYIRTSEAKATIRSILKSVFEAGVDQARRSELERRVAALKAKATAVVQGISPENVPLIDGELTKIRREISSLEAEMGGRAAGPAVLDVDGAVEEILTIAKDFPANFEKATSAERKRILRPFLRGVTVHPAERKAVVELWKLPVADEVRQHVGRCIPRTGFEPVLPA